MNSLPGTPDLNMGEDYFAQVFARDLKRAKWID